ncbi:type VII toxin-antitoxin system HepT family RNase toxin [Dissulfurispira sp.]|uniref:type VII toxin-antitoxin system HepT family RNase toxin n=1 Tax=Dissulfurispira sp. TaxID=2817609 RepID=UPI002FD87E1A
MKREIKQKLLKHINFLENELSYYPKFRQLTEPVFREDDDKRRSVERWVENIINSLVDISKNILTLENIRLPDTYKDIVLSISIVKELNINNAESLARWVRLRNIVAHEYLDIRWSSINKFVSETEPLFKGFLEKVKDYLDKITESEAQ